MNACRRPSSAHKYSRTTAWLSSAAERQLRVRQGLRGVAAWEAEAGDLTAEEIAAGAALLARLLPGVSGLASRVLPC